MCYCIVAGKITFVVSLKKPLSAKVLNHFTHLTIGMEFLIYFSYLTKMNTYNNKHAIA